MADEQELQNKIDDYLLISVIGTGKTAQIWEVMHEQSGQMLAMKLLLPEAMADAEEKAFLKHEAKVAEQLEHPNLIRPHGLVMRKTECYFLMELFKTPNLKQFIHADRAGVHERFRKLVEGTCAGLGHMHDKGWVHKDIKPDNILLNRAGEVRLIDFSLAVRKAGGLSKLLGGGKGAIRGTRTYLAPETIRKEPSTPATDIYSLGITFYEALVGFPPFKGDTPQDLLRKHIAAACPPPSLANSDVTPEMDEFILKMLAKKPKDRFQSMDEVLSAFANIQVFKVLDEEEAEKQKAEEEARIAAGEKSPEEEELEELMMNRRDSRTDARIRELLDGNPKLQEEFKRLQVKQAEAEERRQAELKRRADKLSKEQSSAGPEKKKKKPKPKPAAPQPAAQQPVPQMPYPQQPAMGYPPGYPQMPPGYPQQMPGYAPPPGYGQPPAPMPGMPQPPGYPQQPPVAMPPQGQMPPQQMPPQGVPQQSQPGQQQPGQPQPPAQQPPTQQPPTQQPATPAAQEPQQPKKKGDDMEFMTELPEIE